MCSCSFILTSQIKCLECCVCLQSFTQPCHSTISKVIALIYTSQKVFVNKSFFISIHCFFLLTAQNECSECCVHPDCFTEFFCDLNVVVCQFVIKRNRDITTLSIILKHGKMSLFSVVFFPSILMTDVIPASPIMLTEYCMTIKMICEFLSMCVFP